MKKQNNNDEQIQEGINPSNYLVTEAVDPNSLGNEKLQSDISLLTEAEEKRDRKPDISKSIENPHIKRAASALRLANPFKGH